MSIDDLPAETIDRLKARRWDRIIEKHEGPTSWSWQLERRNYPPDHLIYQLEPDYDPVAETPEFLEIGNQWVLLPIGRRHHPNLTILHHFLSQDGQKLVVYLKDTTFYDDPFASGFVAICDRFAPEAFFVATLYHEWFIIDYDESSRLFTP